MDDKGGSILARPSVWKRQGSRAYTGTDLSGYAQRESTAITHGLNIR